MVAGIRPSSERRAGVMPMGFSQHALVDHHFKLRLNLLKSIKCEAVGFAVSV